MEIDLALCLPREAETVAIVRDIAVSALIRLGVTHECAEDIRLALSEACSNVVDHSEADDEYEVRLLVDETQCEIRVIDSGRGFDAASLQQAAPASADSARGRGISMMQALVDNVTFESKPEEGTIVRLVKTLTLDENGALHRLVRSHGEGQAAAD